MLDELRQAAARQRTARALRLMVADSRELLSPRGEMNSGPIARALIERLETLSDTDLDGYFDYLERDLGPDPQRVLLLAQAYAAAPGAGPLQALTQAVEPPRQELLRRLNRTPGGTAAVLRLRRALLRRLPMRPELRTLEADLLHLLASWFNPGFLQLRRVDWSSPAQLLEKIILREAVHAIDGWDDLRRRLQPDRRCFAFFHPQLPEEPLIFVEVALLPEMPSAIAPLIDKLQTPQPADGFRVAAFYGISNCEPGLRGVSLGNFLIKQVAEHLQQERPRLRTFCTLSPIPGFAAWLRRDSELAAFSELPRKTRAALAGARQLVVKAAGGDLDALAPAVLHGQIDAQAQRALQSLCAAWLVHASPRPDGDPVARFHLDNGARLERLNPRADLAAKGLRQSFGMMVNYLYDLRRIESSHVRFRRGEVVRSRAVDADL